MLFPLTSRKPHLSSVVFCYSNFIILSQKYTIFCHFVTSEFLFRKKFFQYFKNTCFPLFIIWLSLDLNSHIFQSRLTNHIRDWRWSIYIIFFRNLTLSSFVSSSFANASGKRKLLRLTHDTHFTTVSFSLFFLDCIFFLSTFYLLR